MVEVNVIHCTAEWKALGAAALLCYNCYLHVFICTRNHLTIVYYTCAVGRLCYYKCAVTKSWTEVGKLQKLKLNYKNQQNETTKIPLPKVMNILVTMR